MICYSDKKLLITCDDWDILYYRGKVYQYLKKEKRYILIVVLYPKGIKKLLSKIRLSERIFRLEPRCACLINKTEIVFSYDGKIVVFDLEQRQVINIHQCRQGMKNPLQLFRIEGVEGFQESLVYGEYWGNETNEEVCIFSYQEQKWVKKYTFEKGVVQHIHGFVKSKDCVYILTGDKDECSGIWCAENDFIKVSPALCGRQKYRACRGFDVSAGLLYATDTPLEENGLFLWDKREEPKLLFKLPGPCIFATQIQCEDKEYQIFATSVEPDSRYHGLRYLLTYKLGEGVKERYTYLIGGNVEEGFEVIGKYKKDIWPMGLLQFGNIWFPDNHTRELYLVFQSISGKDGITYKY